MISRNLPPGILCSRCLYPTIVIDKKGKQKKKYEYKNMMTPYGKLKSLGNAEQYLKE